MEIKKVMKKPITIDENKTLKEAASVMSKKNISSLVVIDKKNKIAGIISEKDILDNVSKLKKKISSVMSKNVVKIEAGKSLDDAARLMTERKISKMPIVEKNKLVGIITSTDIIANSEDLNEEFFFD